MATSAAAARGIFPIEILEKILFYLDGKSLLRLRSISSVWKQTIDEFIRRFDSKNWQWLCFQTISTNSLIDYLEVDVPAILDPKVFEGKPDDGISFENFSKVNWETLFKNHQNLNCEKKWRGAKESLVNIDIENDPVSCVKVTGNLFVTGHFSGLICLWSVDQGQMIDIYEDAHTNQISQVVFGNVFAKDQYVLSTDMDLKLDYVANHHFLISASLSGRVQARGMALSSQCPDTGKLLVTSEVMELAEHRNPHVQIKLLNKTLAIFSRENSINLWDIMVPSHYVKTPKKLPRFVPKMSLRGPDSCPLFEGILWPNRVAYGWRKFIVMTRSGKSKVLHNTGPYSWQPVRGSDQDMTLVIPRKEEQEQETCKNVSISSGDLFHTETVKMSSLPTKKLFECFGIQSEKGKRIDLFTNVFWAKIFHDDLFVILTKKRQLLLSIDGINFSACGPMKDLNKGHVTCVTYFANVFAIGFATGDIWLFFIKSPLDFHNLDFEEPNVTLKTGNNPITNLTIGLGLSKEETILISSCEQESQVFRL